MDQDHGLDEISIDRDSLKVAGPSVVQIDCFTSSYSCILVSLPCILLLLQI